MEYSGPMTQHSPLPEVPAYRPLDARSRLLIAALALATVVLVMYLLSERPGATFGPRAIEASSAPAAASAASAPWIRSGPVAPERVAPIHVVRPEVAASGSPR